MVEVLFKRLGMIGPFAHALTSCGFGYPQSWFENAVPCIRRPEKVGEWASKLMQF